MAKRGTFVVGAILAVAGVLGAAAPMASAKTTTTTTVPPTTLPIGTVPPTDGTAAASTGTGKILMLKIYVGDIAKAQQFYGTVFGPRAA